MRVGSAIGRLCRLTAPDFEFLAHNPGEVRMNSKWIYTLAIAMLAVACGGSSGPEPKLYVDSSTLTAKVGETVSLTARLENSTDAVVWSVEGPGALSATSGNEVSYHATQEGNAGVVASAAGLTSSVTIKVVPVPTTDENNVIPDNSQTNGDSVPRNDNVPSDNIVPPDNIVPSDNCGGTSDCGPSGGTADCRDRARCEKPITVYGLILNEAGNPIFNQAVFVLGKPATLTHTDGDGYFVINGVTPPYDLAMIEDSSNRVFVYRGLTRKDPTLFVFTQCDQTLLRPRQITLTGNLSGGDQYLPLPLDETQVVGFGSREVRMAWDLDGQAGNTVAAIPGPYSLTVSWNGPETTIGTLVALQVRPDPGTGAPSGYWYAEHPNVSLLSPDYLPPPPALNLTAGPDLMLLPVAGANTQGTILVPPAYSLEYKSMSLSFDKSVFFGPYMQAIYVDQSPATSFKYIAPRIYKAKTQVCAYAAITAPPYAGSFSNTCIDALQPQTDDALLEILAAPQPNAPANGANAVGIGTLFQWSKFKGGVHFVQITPAAGSTNPTYFIFTADTRTTIPDLSAIGLVLGDGAYSWNVTGFAPFRSVDEFTAYIPAPALYPTVDGNLNAQLPVPPVPDAATAQGVKYTFTVPPAQ